MRGSGKFVVIEKVADRYDGRNEYTYGPYDSKEEAIRATRMHLIKQCEENDGPEEVPYLIEALDQYPDGDFMLDGGDRWFEVEELRKI